MIDIGFTGSREEPSAAQKNWLWDIVHAETRDGAGLFHHGCCVGSDEFAHSVAKVLLSRAALEEIALHPPADPRLEMGYSDWDHKGCIWWPRRPYLQRNRDIVRMSDVILALPKEREEQKGGTWYTIRRAIKAKKRVLICYRDGEVERH